MEEQGSCITLKVFYGSNQHDITVSSQSTFGDLKRAIAQETGLEPEVQNLLFREKEKEDRELLHIAGLKDNSKVVVMENSDSADKEIDLEEVKESIELSRGGEAVAEVREQIDDLAEQVAALEAVVCSGTQVADKDFLFVTEMLMRQLLKLDGIEAEGEGRVQRKLEVRRVQSLVETMDNLKERNSNPNGSVEPVTGDLKRAIAQETGLEPEVQNLLFRGKEKVVRELLLIAGLKDNSKVVVMENSDSADKQIDLEEVKESIELSRGGEAVAEVREQIDNLAEWVAALEAVVCSGTQVADKDFLFVTEMLMRQLLKLDGIEAEGEGRVQRKLEVRRVQSLVETMDNLKERNSIPNGSVEPVTGQCDPMAAPVSAPPLPSSI